jgi:non-ribosomal peptide synthase protein (TIGR01720 family)
MSLQPEMMFNYLGQYDQVLPKGSPFSMSTGSVGPVRSPFEKRRYLLEILGRTMDGQLVMAWTFSRNVHKPESIEALTNDFIETLRNIIQHCQSTEAGGFTPSDFPGAKLDQNALDSFLAKLSS